MTGRKLLLADDSVTIQKVIDLTFSDEGMEVTTVGDGEQAIRKLEESTPDIVLADVLMPGPDGYKLCEFIKQSERFRRIPVMLLVGSFEPFDEAEARRVGADDFLTKPFQSIRQLVNRVGSLLGGKPEGEARTLLSSLGLEQASPPSRVDLVETVMEPASAEERDIELQTADTLKLRPVEAVSAIPAGSLSNNFEAQPVNVLTAEETLIPRDDVLLDLDDLALEEATPDVDDSILDLEYIGPVEPAPSSPAEDSQASWQSPTSASAITQEYEAVQATLAQAPVSAWGIEKGQTPGEEVAADRGADARADVELPARQMAATELSPEAVEAIAQRVVEKLSDKVVREIAWEVVPELAELLIKQRLEEKERNQ